MKIIVKERIVSRECVVIARHEYECDGILEDMTYDYRDDEVVLSFTDCKQNHIITSINIVDKFLGLEIEDD